VGGRSYDEVAAAGAEVLIRPIAVFGAVLAAVTLSACGGSVATRSSRVADARARAVDHGSSRFEITYELPDGAPLGGQTEMKGEIDYARGVGRLRVLYNGELAQEMIFAGTRTYVRMPMLAQYLGTSKEWVTFSREEDDQLDVVSFVGGPTDVSDPSKVLEFLLGTSGELRQVGSEDVRGVSTTHYRGAIDMEKVIERAPADERADLRDDLDLLGEDGFPKAIPFDAWIDDDGLARRVRLELVPGETGGAETIEFYDFGVTVDAQPPAASEVLSDEEFAKLIEQHQGDDQRCDDSDPPETETTTTPGGGIEASAYACLQVEGTGEPPKDDGDK
jgi:hypothetical protein